ncbi:MAG: B12-binding domain-containing radical SAM protein [Desulfobacterales bacterium]|nr:B12-binding domain-containing radical SAM protein [Desulfobacterales bacterium]
MNVTLIRPPAYANIMGVQRVPYLGIVYIAASVRAAGHKVDVIDMCGENIDEITIIGKKNILMYGMPFSALNERLKPSMVVGFSCMFTQDWLFNRDLICYVRKLFPESILVAGGEHITAIPEYCLNDCQELDICVVGEGEEVFMQLLSVIERGGSWSEVPSIVYREKKGKGILRTPRAERIKDVNSIPWPAWDLTPMDNYLSRRMHYLIHGGRTIPMYASRGCPYKCTFCSNNNMWGNLWFGRDPKDIVKEMKFYVSHYNAENFVFNDLTFGINKKGVASLCNEIIKHNLDITWQAPCIRADALDYATLKLMSQAGCTELHFAFESGSQKVLDGINKTFQSDEMISSIKAGLAVGMNITVNIILGLPGEGYKEFFQTYFLLMKGAVIGLHEINVFPFILYPGSKLFYEVLKEGKIALNDEYLSKMLAYIDLTHAVSFSEKFSPRMLNFLRVFLLGSFYSLMFLSHPKRIVQLIVDAARGKPTTKLAAVLRRVVRNARVYFFERYRKR